MTTYLLLLMLFAPHPNRGALVQLGAQTAHFRITVAGQQNPFPSYSNNGYKQAVRYEKQAIYLEVKVRNKQLATKMRALKAANFPVELQQLQGYLNKGQGSLADQVMALFTWLRQEIKYDMLTEEAQDLNTVLTRRRANCIGMANLSIFVLRELGLQARYVTGLAFQSEDRVKLHLEGNVLHRWIEVYYEDVGWVFGDPAGKVNFVEATYIVLGVEEVHPLPQHLQWAQGARVELLNFNNGLRTVTRIPEADSRLRVRPNRLYQE